MLPITPAMIPEENAEKQEDEENSPEKKCAACQTTTDDTLETNYLGTDSKTSEEKMYEGDMPKLCRCPNCNCSNCNQEFKHLNSGDDNQYRNSESDDEDSGTESYTNEEIKRKLSVSSLAKSSASVLIHSCFVSKPDE